MDPIPVPAPPRSAYNPNRRVSDLLLNQVKHFQHVEHKRGDLGIAPEIARDIYTEGGAARYIAAVTTALRDSGSAAAAPSPKLAVFPTPKPEKKPPTAAVLDLAASAAEPPSSSTAKKSPRAKTKKSGKKSTKNSAARKA